MTRSVQSLSPSPSSNKPQTTPTNSSYSHLSSRWHGPIPASCLLQVIFGLIYSSGIFIALINDPSFTFAIGITGSSTSLGITLSGIVMNRFIPSSHTIFAPRYVALLGSVLLSCQALLAVALVIHSNALLFFAAVLQGFGAGSIYVSSVDVLQAWAPDAPGFFTGLGMLCGGMGSVIGIPIYALLASTLGGAVPALAMAGILAGCVAMIGAWRLRRLPNTANEEHDVNSEEQKRIHEEELSLLLVSSKIRQHSNYRLTVKQVFFDPQFWCLWAAFASTVGPGFAVILGFQSVIKVLLNVDVTRANRLFFWVTLTGVGGRLGAGVLVDLVGRRMRKEPSKDIQVMKAAKLVTCTMLVCQTLAVLSIPLAVDRNNIRAFTVAVAVVYVTFSGGSVTVTCMARGIFLPQNTSLAYSLLGISIGVGDLFFSWLIATCGKLAEYAGEENKKDAYRMLFFVSLVWSIGGFLTTRAIQQSKYVDPSWENDIVQQALSNDTRDTSLVAS